jgi:hypothetical protein
VVPAAPLASINFLIFATGSLNNNFLSSIVMAIKNITQQIIDRVAEAAAIHSNRLHVLPRNEKWVVRRDGARRVMGIFGTRDEALNLARLYVNNGSMEYAVVHDSNGHIAETIGK